MPTSPSSSEPWKVRKVALLTAGGLAPCLSSCVGTVIERFTEIDPSIEIIAYHSGYSGLLRGEYFVIGQAERSAAHILHRLGGSPLGNSRVKLTNKKDAERRGLIKKGEDPREVAARQLTADGVDVLITIGGDDTNTAAATLAEFTQRNNSRLLVIGLPKTIDNDIVPIRLTLGASTAAEQGAAFCRSVINDHASSSSGGGSLIVNEIMGRASGSLTVGTALVYEEMVNAEKFPAPGLFQHGSKEHVQVHALYIPEDKSVDLAKEGERLKAIMKRTGVANVFVSEGWGAEAIAAELEAQGKPVPKDAFGHMKLDAVNVGAWLGARLGQLCGARKVLVAKSGYFARAAPANTEDLTLIKSMADLAVECALANRPGVIGHDLVRGGLRNIEFERIKGHRQFSLDDGRFRALLRRIGQKSGGAGEEEDRRCRSKL